MPATLITKETLVQIVSSEFFSDLLRTLSGVSSQVRGAVSSAKYLCLVRKRKDHLNKYRTRRPSTGLCGTSIIRPVQVLKAVFILACCFLFLM